MMLRALVLATILAIGVVGGIALSESGVIEKQVSPDVLCNQHLAGDAWSANISQSTDIDDGTELHCVHENGTQRTLTLDINLEVVS